MIDLETIIEERHRKLWGCSDTPLLVMLCLAIFFTVSWLLPTFLYVPVNVLGASMEPTLFEDDKVILFKQGEINFGDIVVAHAPRLEGGRGKDVIKRVIGLPGETIRFEAKQVDGRTVYIIHRQKKVGGMTVDISIQDEFYVKDVGFNKNLDNGDVITLGEDEYFLMGDNRGDSLDSRSPDLGPVKREQIKGKALLIIRGGEIIPVRKIKL